MLFRKEVYHAIVPYYLSKMHFAQMLLLAFALHCLVFLGWHFTPKSEVQTITVRALNIKLGSEDGSASIPSGAGVSQMPAQSNVIQARTVEATLLPVVHAIPQEVIDSLDTMIDQSQHSDKKPQAAKDTEKPKKYVRESIDTSGAEDKKVPATSMSAGSPFGNSSNTKAETKARYEQLISLWMDRHKIYPEAARNASIEGKAILRIRINRTGEILYYAIEQSTGASLLDAAVVKMVESANPMPTVPSDYPAGELLEFLIPVMFSLQ